MATSMAAATIGHVKLLRPLRERDFALLWTGMTVSLLGDGIFLVAEAWQVYDRRLPDRRGHLRYERGLHLEAPGAIAAGARRRALGAPASCARGSSSSARSRGCGRRSLPPR
jgi:hypothetical protein